MKGFARSLVMKMDLEEEFKKLMEDTLNVIEQRRNDGAYDDWDAAELSSFQA